MGINISGNIEGVQVGSNSISTVVVGGSTVWTAPVAGRTDGTRTRRYTIVNNIPNSSLVVDSLAIAANRIVVEVSGTTNPAQTYEVSASVTPNSGFAFNDDVNQTVYSSSGTFMINDPDLTNVGVQFNGTTSAGSDDTIQIVYQGPEGVGVDYASADGTVRIAARNMLNNEIFVWDGNNWGRTVSSNVRVTPVGDPDDITTRIFTYGTSPRNYNSLLNQYDDGFRDALRWTTGNFNRPTPEFATVSASRANSTTVEGAFTVSQASLDRGDAYQLRLESNDTGEFVTISSSQVFDSSTFTSGVTTGFYTVGGSPIQGFGHWRFSLYWRAGGSRTFLLINQSNQIL